VTYRIHASKDVVDLVPALSELWRVVEPHDEALPDNWFWPRIALADLVAALGGTLDLDDPPGQDKLDGLLGGAGRGRLPVLRLGLLRFATSGPLGRQQLADLLVAAPPELWLSADAAMRGLMVPRPWAGWLASLDVVAVGLSSMQRDGYAREAATRRLIDHSEPVAAGFLAMRTVDFITGIRDVATREIELRLPIDEHAAAIAIPILLAVGGRSRANRGTLAVDAALASSAQLQRRFVRNRDKRARRHALQVALEQGTLTQDELIDIAFTDIDTVTAAGAGVAAVRSLVEAGDLDRARLLLRGPRVIRREALDAWPQASPSARVTAEAYLFDSSPLVRTGAQGLFRRSGGDPTSEYRGALTSSRASIALVELGSIGTSADRDVILAALDSPDERIRRAAVQAITWLDGDALVEAIGRLARDPSPAVAIAAARRLRRVAQRVSSEDVIKWLTRPEPGVRLAGLAITKRRRDIDRLEADLTLFNDDDPSVRFAARRDLTGVWVGRATSFSPRADRPTRSRVSHLLDDAALDLDPVLLKTIRFAAGLRPSDLT